MPLSSPEGKAWTKERISALAADRPVDVVDIGPGVGTYAKLLDGVATGRVIGIEVWEPYVDTYRLRDYYDDIVVGDARTTNIPPTDVVILGDVIEHMTRDEALNLWRRAGDAARRAVYLSIPIVHYPQGEIEHNPYEVHVVDDWNHESVLAAFDGIKEFSLGETVGVYERLTA